MDFKPSNPGSIGLELELQLLDADTLNLVDGILPLIDFFPDSPYVKPEFIQNTVELTTRVCSDIGELREHMFELARDVRSRCDQLGMRLCGAGTHPFCERLALITPIPRYQRMEKASGYLGHTQITFATHVHVGMQSGQQMIETMNQLKAYLPLLIAISANSPFWRGYETGYASYRHRILAASRSYGIPPSFDSWHDFENFVETTRHAGVFDTIPDIHWDIRPRPHLGSLEVRVMDAQSSIGDAIAIAALVRTLVTFIRDRRQDALDESLPQPLPWWLEKENHFQASRKGLKARYVATAQGDSLKMKDVWRRVTSAIRPVSRSLGEEEYLDYLIDRINEDPPYMRQQREFERSGSLRSVVDDCVSQLVREL
jgi:carboxylate-amine ligase